MRSVEIQIHLCNTLRNTKLFVISSVGKKTLILIFNISIESFQEKLVIV